MKTAERLARNNSLFREANEEIRAKAETYGTEMSTIPFLCECAAEDCREVVRIPLSEYATIRSETSHFLITPGHEDREGTAAVVARNGDSYVVVEKVGEAREALERQDP
jgi:hypothetical protein